MAGKCIGNYRQLGKIKFLRHEMGVWNLVP